MPYDVSIWITVLVTGAQRREASLPKINISHSCACTFHEGFSRKCTVDGSGNCYVPLGGTTPTPSNLWHTSERRSSINRSRPSSATFVLCVLHKTQPSEQSAYRQHKPAQTCRSATQSTIQSILPPVAASVIKKMMLVVVEIKPRNNQRLFNSSQVVLKQ